jgi:hypothetical protein
VAGCDVSRDEFDVAFSMASGGSPTGRASIDGLRRAMAQIAMADL